MQPGQPQSPQNPYDFIMNPGQGPKKPWLPLSLGGKSRKARLAILLGGALAALVLLLFLFSLFTGGNDISKQLLGLTQEQAEIIRVSAIAKDKARKTDTLNFAISTNVSVASSQQQFLAVVKKDQKVDSKILDIKKNTQTDQKLTSAALNNNFDEVFMEEMQKELASYQRNLREAFNATSSSKTKQLLQSAYNGVDTLLGTTTQSN